MMRVLLAILTLGLFNGLVACTKIDSDLVSPGEIYFSARVSEELNDPAAANSITCATTTYHRTHGSDKIVDLIDGDKLTCNGVRMRREDNMFGFTYVAHIPKAADRRYQIIFYRTGVEYSSASVQLPTPFAIQSPHPSFQVGPEEHLDVQLDPVESEGIRSFVELKVSDEFSVQQSVQGNKPITLPSLKETYQDRPLPQAVLGARLKVERSREINGSGKFNGSFEATVSRIIQGTYDPQKHQ